MTEEQEVKYYHHSRNGVREIKRAEILRLLTSVGMDHVADMVLRDIEGGVPYQGATFKISNRDTL